MLDTQAQEAKQSAPPTPTLPEAADKRNMIEETLRKTGGNKQKAAQVLGLSRQGLIKKLKRLSINQ